MYSRKSGNPSPLPGFAFALHCSWLLIQLQRGQMVYFSGQKKLSFQWHQQHAHLWSTWPSDSPRILLSPHHSPDINSLAVCSQLGTHGPSSPAEEEMMPVGASNLRRPRALPAPPPPSRKKSFLVQCSKARKQLRNDAFPGPTIPLHQQVNQSDNKTIQHKPQPPDMFWQEPAPPNQDSGRILQSTQKTVTICLWKEC